MSSEMKSWDQCTPLEQAQYTFWDMYKDAHGFRPRHIDTSGWTIEQFEAEFAQLGEVMSAYDALRKLDEAIAVEKFEHRIAQLISTGAKDYDTAMRWIHEAEQTNGDDEYLAWTLNLPYRYFTQRAEGAQ